MYWLKTCPRCHGDLHEVHYIAALETVRDIVCMQCVYVLTAEQEKLLMRATQKDHMTSGRWGLRHKALPPAMR